MTQFLNKTIDIASSSPNDVFQLGSINGTDVSVELEFTGVSSEDSIWQVVQYNNPENKLNLVVGLNVDGEAGIKLVESSDVRGGYLGIRYASAGTETAGTINIKAVIK